MFGKLSFIRTLDYYEAFIMMIVAFIIISTQCIYADNITLELAQALSPFFVLSILSVILMKLEYKGYDCEWLTYGTMVTTGMFIGFTHFNLLFMLAVFICFANRLAKTAQDDYVMMFVFKVSATVIGFLLSIYVDIFSIDIFKGSFFNFVAEDIFYILLILVVSAIVYMELIDLFDQVEENEDKSEAYEVRIKSLMYTNNSLARFVPNQIWRPLIRDNKPVSVSNQRSKLTIFFSDIVGFTSLSDNLSADILTDILSTYMHRMTIVAQRHDAVLDKFIGDGMMCFFGAHGHKSVKENSLACIEMAIDMRREMRELRRNWQAEGFEGLYVRMGVNTGFCHVGNFGTDLRMSYTAIGKEVNLASRLESIAEPDEIVISQSTYDYISYDYNCEMMGAEKLKGIDDVVTCWRVKDPITSELKASQRVIHELPGFNLHLNFKDMKNYDYQSIRKYLNKAIERVDSAEIISELSSENQKF